MSISIDTSEDVVTEPVTEGLKHSIEDAQS